MVATGKNWSIPCFWAPIIRYISCPILSIIMSFAYPAFYKRRMDPLHIFAFSVAHVMMVIVGFGFIFPRAFDIFIPPERRENDSTTYAPQVTIMGVCQGGEVVESGAGTEENQDFASKGMDERK